MCKRSRSLRTQIAARVLTGATGLGLLIEGVAGHKGEKLTIVPGGPEVQAAHDLADAGIVTAENMKVIERENLSFNLVSVFRRSRARSPSESPTILIRRQVMG